MVNKAYHPSVWVISVILTHDFCRPALTYKSCSPNFKMQFKMVMVLKGQINTPRMNHKIVVKGFDIRKLNKEIPALLPAEPS